MNFARHSATKHGIGPAPVWLGMNCERALFGWGAIGLAGLLVLGGCSRSAPKSAPERSDVLAQVGDREIRLEDVLAEVEFRRAARRPVPDKETLVQEMITQEALVQRARQAGLADDFAVKRELNSLLIGRLWEREVTPKLETVRVTEEEIQAEYERNLGRYAQPAKVRLAMLHLEKGLKPSDEKRAGLRQRLEEARRKAIENPATGGRGPAATGFGALAIDYSEDQVGRYRGGDLGWLDAGNLDYPWPREVLAAGYGLAKGKISDVIETGTGLYLVMKSDAREGSVTPLQQVQAALRQSLLVKKRGEVEESFRQDAARLAGSKVDATALARLELPRGATTRAREAKFEQPRLPEVGQPARAE